MTSSTQQNKVCDRCGIEIPDSAHRSMSDVDTYWCDACEGMDAEGLADVERRLADRNALGVAPRDDDPLSAVGTARKKEQ